MEAAVMDQAVRAVVDREGKYLTFALAGEEYGIAILKVKEIIGLMPITTVPRPQVMSRASSTSGGRSSP